MLEKQKYFLHPGYIFVSKKPYIIHTVLGSCISVCIWDSKLKFGGMNHYIHPYPFNNERNTQFGTVSIPHMIKLLVNMGGNTTNFKTHIVGGATSSQMQNSLIGKNNITVAEKILKENSIDIITFDTGGDMGRKVIFDNETGEIVIYKVNNIRECDWNENNKNLNNR
ncbi:MAG: chemotaxis protein CheD [Candidatus Gastranaerophilales bacterium]|nr:chemotaxis protein CheD [Candidatus Gastranaerophilales bacterium]